MRNYTEKKGIYYHNSGLFRIRERKGRNLEVAFTDCPGKWFSSGSTDFYEAEDFANEKLIKDGFGSVNSKTLFRDFASRFFSRSDSDSYRHRKESFGKKYRDIWYLSNQSWLDRYIMPKFGNMPISMIKPLMIERWYVELKGIKQSLSNDTKMKILYCLSQIMNEARRQGIIESNPCNDVEKLPGNKSSRSVFTKSELEKLFPESRAELYKVWFDYESNPRKTGSGLFWATYFSIMCDTGFRPGEVAGLSKDCFIDNGVFTKRSVDSMTKSVKDSIKTTGKGQEFKVGILSSYTMSLVKDLMELTDDKYLFKLNGSFIDSNMSNEHFKESCRRAGLSDCNRVQYCLRHTFNTNMLNSIGKNVTEDDVRKLMGHRRYRKEYDHRTAEDLISSLQGVRTVIEKSR